MSDTATETRTIIKPKEDVKEPPMFKVIYLNDNQTSMEFVITSLVEHFAYNPATAEKLTIDKSLWMHVALGILYRSN